MVRPVEAAREGRPQPDPTPEPDERAFETALAEQRRGEREAGRGGTEATPPAPLVTTSPPVGEPPEPEVTPTASPTPGPRRTVGPSPGPEPVPDTVEEPARETGDAGGRDPEPTVAPVPGAFPAPTPTGTPTAGIELPTIGPMPPERQDFVSRAWDLLRPDSYSVGISQTAPASPVKGVLLMQTPWGSWPWETSPTTGRNETTIVGNLRTPWKAGDWGIGGNAQLGLDPVRGAGGVAFVQTFDNPVMPFTVIGTTRYGVRPDTNQTVVSASVGVNTPVDAVVSRGLFVGAAVAAAIPPLAPAAPVLLRAGAAVDQAGRAWGQALPRPVVGVGWQGELRWTNGHDGSPPEFDGLYRRNQRVDLPDAVENAIAQESQGALMPEAGPVGSFAARVATNVLEALPPAGEWADAIPEAARPGLAVVAESIAEEMRDPTLMVPSPLGLARHLVENAREAGLMPFTPPGAAGWAETLLGLQPSR